VLILYVVEHSSFKSYCLSNCEHSQPCISAVPSRQGLGLAIHRSCVDHTEGAVAVLAFCKGWATEISSKEMFCGGVEDDNYILDGMSSIRIVLT